MTELSGYVRLGFEHITDPGELDHVLFLIVLAVVYRPRDWRSAIWVVTAFTVGHSITLALAALGIVAFPGDVVEFLIPVTIVATALANLWHTEPATTRVWRRAAITGTFGLVHGAGFAGYLHSLLIDEPLVPLLGFNVGIELGQILVLAIAVALMSVLDRAIDHLRLAPAALSPLRLRVTMVSVVVAAIASTWAFARAPW